MNTCPLCGSTFYNGWGWYKHQRTCQPAPRVVVSAPPAKPVRVTVHKAGTQTVHEMRTP